MKFTPSVYIYDFTEYDWSNPIWSLCHTVNGVVTLITRAELENATEYHKLTIL